MLPAPPPPENNTRPAALLLVSCLAVVLLAVALLAGQAMMEVIATVFADGLIPLIDVAAATLAGMAVVRRIMPDVRRTLLIASGAGLGLGLLLTAALLLGLGGWLGASTSWLLVGVLALGGVDLYFDRARWRRPIAVRPVHWLWLIAMVPLGVALTAATAPPGIMWGDEPHGYDVLSYHLQIPREWYEAGRIAALEHNVFSYFPLGQETLSLVLMHQMGGPWEAMYSAQLMSLLLMVIATLAVAGAVGQVFPAVQLDPKPQPGATDADGLAAPVVAGVLFAALPWSAMLGSVAYNEALLMAAAALAAAWLVRAVSETTERGSLEAAEGQVPRSEGLEPHSRFRPLLASPLVRAALMAGLFIGLGVAAKYPAAPMLGVAGGLALLLVLPWRRAPRHAGTAALAMAGGAMVLSLPWLLRNLAWTGNPVFPLATSLFGDGGWDPALIDRWHRAHTIAPTQTRLGQLTHDLLLNPRYAAAPIPPASPEPWLRLPVFWPIVILAAAWGCRRRDLRAVLLTAWLGVMLLIWLLFTHLQGRFLVLATPVAAILAGMAVTRGLRLPAMAAAGLVAAAGLMYLLPAASRRMELAREADAFGIRDLTILTVIEDPSRLTGRELYLVGDARAFLYPARPLHYRVVFDVPAGSGALRAWLGDHLQSAPEDALVVIDPAEVERLSRPPYEAPPLELAVPRTGVWTMRQIRDALGTPGAVGGEGP